MKKKRKNSNGILTLDFIFSFLTMYGISMVFGLMAFTLMMSSVAQYIIFATNRAHISAHVNKNKQLEMGDRKFERLVSSLSPFFGTTSQSWFQVQLRAPDDSPPSLKSQKAYGYKLNYTANVMKNARFPIIGGPGDSTQEGNFGRATLKAYMYREPTTEECIRFNRKRWEKILKRFSNLGGGYIRGSDAYGSSSDNGC